MTADGRTYKEYLQSDEWQRHRKEKIERSLGICEECGSRMKSGQAHCHHSSYKNFGHESDGDTKVMHKDCHLIKVHKRVRRVL